MKFLARLILLMLLPLAALAVPNYINYQGRLLDGNGIPVTQAGMSMVVSIWTASTAGAKLYQENHTVNVDDGVYSLQIGNGTGGTPAWNPPGLFNTSSPRFVELTIQGQTLTPRHELLSAPFTLQSGNSDNLGGQPIGYFGTAAVDTSLQNQINTLLNQLAALQVICLSAHGYWDGTTCLPAIAVIPDPLGKGDDVPVSQLLKRWTDSEVELECAEPHYHAYPNPNKGGIMPVTNCNGTDITQEPAPRACAFGKESEVVYIDAAKCPGFPPKPKG